MHLKWSATCPACNCCIIITSKYSSIEGGSASSIAVTLIVIFLARVFFFSTSLLLWHRFEYLTTQICFLQGLFNWLAAVAIELVLPKAKETESANRMNRCLAAWLTSMIVWMLAFYNHHLSFYSDYATMLWRWSALFVKNYFFERPIRPLSLIYIPAMGYSAWMTWKAFRSAPELDEE